MINFYHLLAAHPDIEPERMFVENKLYLNNINAVSVEELPEEQEIQQLQKQEKTSKETSLNKLNALQSTIQHLSSSNYSMYNKFRDVFQRLFEADERTFKSVLSRNMHNLERKLHKETLHEKDSNSDLYKRNEQGLENQSNTYGDESSRSRNECNDKSTSRDDTDIRPSYDIEPMVEVPYTAEYNVFAVDKQHSEQPECINNTCVVETGDSNVIPDSPDMCDNDIQNDQNFVECDDERVALANLIANLKLDVDENNKIQKQLKKANTTLAQELKECKSILAETSRTLGEYNSIRDSCLVALQSKQTEFEKYKACNNRTVDYDKLERKLNETLGLLAQKDIDIKEGLKLKAYEISIVQQKHDELVKQSLLTKSHYEGLVKAKTKVITDLKLKEEHDIDKMISMEKQLKFLNDIVYKRNQSIQTIQMLASKVPTHNGRPTLANPRYLKQAQSEIPCLYVIPNDQSNHANRLIPDWEETLTLEKDSRSKLNKDLVRHLKAQLQDKNIAISELNKLIEKMKGKSVNTKFEKPSILEKPPLQPIRNQPVVRQPSAYKCKRSQLPRQWKSSFAKPYDVTAPDPSRKSPKHVSFQTPRESVGSNDMVHNYYLEEAKKKAQLQNDKALNTKPSGFKEFSTDEQAMTFDHNSSELRIHDHSNEPSSSMLVPKVVPLANKTATSRQELGLLFHHHITMLRSTFDDGVAASFQRSQIHYHMLMLKLQRHTKHQDLRIKKAQTQRQRLSQTLIYKDLPLRYQVYRGRLLASFQDDAKYEHGGQDTRSQGASEQIASPLAQQKYPFSPSGQTHPYWTGQVFMAQPLVPYVYLQAGHNQPGIPAQVQALSAQEPHAQSIGLSTQQSPAIYPAQISYALHSMTSQDPFWNMDNGAFSHLTENTGILTFFSNSSIYPSDLLAMDYQTQKILLHCDSTGDLYPVTQQPPLQTPVVLLSFSSTTWHRLLGHPGDDVLRPLESSNLISCNKSKLPALCHAC
nr:ribonuclease H-like domain-containing protein [Tanacetum cinerariifolium]